MNIKANQAYIIDRIIIDQKTGCWIWQKSKNKAGYGRRCATIDNQEIYVHRASFVAFKGNIPDKLFVLHSCDIPSCCNPEHLFLGTHTDNMTDCISKGRNYSKSKTHCKRGHSLIFENIRTNNKGWRQCKICFNYLRKMRRKSILC